MELVDRRRSALAMGGCVLSVCMGARVQAMTGNAGVLLGLLLATAVVSWYAGRWAGLATTGLGAAAASYFFLPPIHSWQVFRPQDSGALYSFAIGGVIISLLCGAAWQLRAEARSLQVTENELTHLRSLNSGLLLRIQHQDAAITASDRILQEFARTARTVVEAGGGGNDFVELARYLERDRRPSPQPVDCKALLNRCSLPTVWADPRDTRELFEIIGNLEISASQLPEWWLFVASIHSSATPPSPMQLCICERLVVSQGGRWWTATTHSGASELRFLLPRRELTDVLSLA